VTRARPLVAAVALAALLAGCGTATAGAGPTSAPPATPSASATPSATPTTEPTTIRIASLRGPTTMGLVQLMAAADAGEARHDYEVTMYGTPDEVVPKIVQGEVDVALLPANLAAVLYHRTKGQVQVAAINTLGMLEVLESGTTVDDLGDLEGRTVYSTGKGATPEHVLAYLLESHGLDPATDVDIEFRSEATEVAALLAAEPGAIGVLPQPYATVLTTQHPEVRTALRLNDEWGALMPGAAMVTGVVLVRRQFAEENPAAFDEFLTDYEASTTFTTTHPDQAAPLVVDAGIAPSVVVAEAAIPACNITYLEGDELVATLGGYLAVLLEADPASIGGSLPGDDFYHRR